MNLGLAGQSVVVLGVSGIGRAVSKRFAKEGCQVGVIDRDPQVVHTVEKELGELKTPHAGLCHDVTDYEGLCETVTTLTERFGRLDHIVFAVGMATGKAGFPFWNLEPSDWAKTLEVNLIAAVNTAHAFAPALTQAQRGTFLFFSSVAGQIGSQTDPPYSAAKAALINFVQCMAKDLAPYNIRANALSPGMVPTDLNRQVWAAMQDTLPEKEHTSYEKWGMAKNAAISPLGRWQSPEECAAYAAFLASDHARNITGQTLNVDGGQVMHS